MLEVLPPFGKDKTRLANIDFTQFFCQKAPFLDFWNQIYKAWGFQKYSTCTWKVLRNMFTWCLFCQKSFQFEWKNGIFLGEMHRHMSHEEEQKNFFCCSQVVLAWGLFEGFFGLKKAEGLLKAKKIPKTARRPKQAWLKQNKIFCSSKWWKMSCIDPKMPFFLSIASFFPFKKWNSLFQKFL